MRLPNQILYLYVLEPLQDIMGKLSLISLKVLLYSYPSSNQLTDTVIVLRSTVPPGTTESKLLTFKREQVFFAPEFLREGSAVSDFYNSNCIIGAFEKIVLTWSD